MPGEFRLRRRVQFYETDAAGFVHFSCFFRYLEEAEHAMWREAGQTIFREGSSIAWPRVAASFEYFRPLRFEDEFELYLRVTGRTAKTIRYTVLITKGETRIASGSMTIACVSKRPGEPVYAIEIPSEIDALFPAGVENLDAPNRPA